MVQESHVDMMNEQKQTTTEDEEVMTRVLNSQISNKHTTTDQKNDSMA